MSALPKTGHSPWKKLGKVIVFFIIAIIIAIAGIKVWDRCSFYFRSGVADAAEAAREKELWLAADFLSRDYVAVYADIKGAVPSPNDGNGNKPRKFNLAKLQKISADFARQLRKRKEQLLQLADDADIGYRSDVLRLYSLFVKQLELSYMNLELCVNAEAKYQRSFDSDLGEKFYELYIAEDREREFKYPDIKTRTKEYERSYAALYRTAFWCMREHGGFRLYQGDSSADVRSDLAAFANYNQLQDLREDIETALSDAQFRCLERRFEHGSSFAALWYPIIKAIPEIIVQSKLSAVDKSHDFLAEPMRVNGYIIGNSREDRMWNTANYLALCTDNFLWDIKFSVKHSADADKLLKWRMQPQYDKDGAEMKFYGEAFSSDIQLCQRDIAAEASSTCPDLQKASLELCAAANNILAVWERFSQDQISYETFFQELQSKEQAFAAKRQTVIKKRWDYLYSYSSGSRGYTISSLVFDGVPDAALKPLAEQQQDNAPAQ